MQKEIRNGYLLEKGTAGRCREQTSVAIKRVLAAFGGQPSPPIPPSVDALVRAYCADYDRRQRALEAEEGMRERPASPPRAKESAGVARLVAVRKRALPASLARHYREINRKIDEAIASQCDEALCEVLRRDIGERLGHRRTSLYFMDGKTYARTKRRAKLAIAAALELL